MAKFNGDIGMFGDLDLNVLAEALARPGMDPRVWVSYAMVAEESDDQKSVEFDATVGPCVWVILQPHNQKVMCRVASGVAGNGEGEWAPFLAGDEVLVVVPEGDTRAMPVIVGRLNNEFDAFPEYVAGYETSKNNMSFRRGLGPYIVEGDSSIILRSAVTGAMIGIDELGNATLRNGDGSVFQLGATGIAMQNADGDMQIALDVDAKSVNLMAGASGFKLADSGASSMMTSGALELSACGVNAVEHLLTLEQLINILAFVLVKPGGGVGIWPGPLGFPDRTTALAAIGGALAAISLLPITGVNAMITAALTGQFKPPAIAGGQLMPGVGCSGLLGG